MKLFYFLEDNFECLHLSRITYPYYIRSILLEGLILIPIAFSGHSSEKSDFIAVLLAHGIAQITGYSVINLLTDVFEGILASENTRVGFNKVWTEQMFKYIAVSWIAGLAIALVWLNGGNITILLSQDAGVSHKTDTYLTIHIAIIPVIPILMGSLKLLDATNTNHTVSVIILLLANSLDILLCYLLLYKTNLGIKGLAISLVVAYYTAALLILAYITCTRFTVQIFYTNRWLWLFNWSKYITNGFSKCTRVFSDIFIFQIGLFIVAIPKENRYINIGTFGVLLYLNAFASLWGKALEYGISKRLKKILQNRFFLDAKNTLVTSIVWSFVSSLTQSLCLVSTAGGLGWVFSGDIYIANTVGESVYLIAILSFCIGIRDAIRGQKSGWASIKDSCLVTAVLFVTGLVLAILFSQIWIKGVKGYWVGLTVWGIIVLFCVLIRAGFLYRKWLQQLHYTTPLPTMSPSNVTSETECVAETSYSYDRESTMFKSFRVESVDSNTTTPDLYAGSSIASSIEVNERSNLYRPIDAPRIRPGILKWVVFKRTLLVLLLVAMVTAVSACKYIHQHLEVLVNTNFSAPINFCCVSFIPTH